MSQRFGAYELVRTLGRGTSATVIEATRDGERFALKVPHPHLQDRELEARLLRQVEISSSIASPFVTQSLAIAREGFQLALVLSLTDGANLRERVEGPLTDREAWFEVLACDLSRALVDVHEAKTASGAVFGLVHGDVSPANVLVGRDGFVRLTDLGEAKRHAISAVTGSAAFRGTPGYMAPEVVRGLPPSAASDVFSLGATLLEVLLGAPVFGGRDAMERARATVEQRPAIPLHPQRVALEGMLAKRPERRPSAATLQTIFAGSAVRSLEGSRLTVAGSL